MNRSVMEQGMPVARRAPRVAHVTTVHHPFDPRIFHRECGTLCEAGFEVHLVAPHDRSETRGGIAIAALPCIEGRYRRILLHPWAYRAARALNADLYHFHDPELIPVAYALKRFTGAAVVYDMHEDYRAGRGREGRLLRALERWCFRWIDHVVISDAAYGDVTAGAGVHATLVPNYFKPPRDSGELQPSPPKPLLDQVHLAYTGVMSEDRGLGNLLGLAALLREEQPRWRLSLAGVCYRKEQRRRAQHRIEAEQLDKVIARTGWSTYVPWQELLAECRRAHVGLALWKPTPGHPEKIPTKFYEYLNLGLPILCSDFPLWQRFVEANECGAAVPPDDPAAILHVLRRWTGDPSRYETLAGKARHAAQRYRWASVSERLVRLYRDLLR